MMQAKREQPQAEYYLRLEVPNCCSGQLSFGGSITIASKFRRASVRYYSSKS
jgi:hypothetical protein